MAASTSSHINIEPRVGEGEMSSSKRIIETWQISEEDWRKMKPFPGGQSLVWNIPGLNTHGAGMGSRAYLDVGGYEEDELIFIITMKWKPTCDLDKVKVQAAVSVRKAGIKSGGPKNISPSSYLRRQTTNVFGFEFVLSNKKNAISVVRSENWKLFVNNYGDLVTEIFEAMAS